MLLELVGLVVAALLLLGLLGKDPDRLHGKYSLPGRWFYLKKGLFYVLLSLRSWQNRRKKQKLVASKDQGAGYGLASRASVDDMEKLQILADHPKAIDTAYFDGFHKDGTVFMLRVARRPNRTSEVWTSLEIPGIGTLQQPMHPDTTAYNTDGNFSGAGLRFECIEPMKKWKITFNGLLRNELRNEWSEENYESKLLHVKFTLMWEAFTPHFDFDVDCHPNVIAEAIATEKWTKEFWETLRALHQTHYEQWGELRGTLQVEGHEDMHIRLRGVRDRTFGVRNWIDFHRYIIHWVILEDGTVFHLTAVCMPSMMSHLRVGYLCTPNGVMHSISWTDLELYKLGEDHNNTPDNYQVHFKAGGKLYHMEVSCGKLHKFHHGQAWTSLLLEKLANFRVNGLKGLGIVEFNYGRSDGSPVPVQQSVPMMYAPETIHPPDQAALILPFTRPACASSTLVGGKGCQLAQLMQMNSQEFVVPDGFCLTIAAFQHQMQESPEIQKAVLEVEQKASHQGAKGLQEACEAVGQQFMRATVCPRIKEAITTQLEGQFTGCGQATSFAVRSSAAGEDSEELSAAGQMDTFLGVKGLEQILEAILKCWASHFAFQAVEYRRQHGQPITSTMGVVIQEMVQSEVSGVLFTQDPLTGNPGIISINATYGLGESVVSGSVEPDTITIRRSPNDRLQIVQTAVGSKKTQLQVTADGGTEERSVEGEATGKCCLRESMILKLANIGIQLEKAYASPRDVEWAVYQDTIFLLQARPITTLGLETDWDMLHEFDTPLCSDGEWLTKANIGEMMPGAMTPLTLSTFYHALENCWMELIVSAGVVPCKYVMHKFLGLACNHGFINLSFQHGFGSNHVAGMDKRAAELALMGEVLDDLTMDHIDQYWGASPWYKRILGNIATFRHLNKSYYSLLQWEEKLKRGYSVGSGSTNAHDLYRAISAALPDFYDAWWSTFTNSARSGIWSNVVMAVLTQGKPEWKTEHYSDMAMLLSKCEDVYSADVPAALERLATTIRNSGRAQEVINMTPEAMVTWLQSEESGQARAAFNTFLENQGHRCVREAEFREKSWKSEPVKVVTVIQALLKVSKGRVSEGRAVQDTGEAVSKIKSKTTAVGRFILKRVLPRARRAVGEREWGKSVTIQVADTFKRAYWKLAELMVSGGYLPDTDLLFFLTHREIGKHLVERSGKLVVRAQRRKRILATQMDLKFPRVVRGKMEPEENGVEDDFNAVAVKLQGMPVSQGRTQGTARVVKTLQAANEIQAGDILVVPYTDVGWSPYFPLISGLVTEIGGLLSHGAVVAREYGLPCVVNVKRATTLIKSGDQVILDGLNGSLEKLE